MTNAEQACLEAAFRRSIERWQGRAQMATESPAENYAEGGVRALEELQEQIERMGL